MLNKRKIKKVLLICSFRIGVNVIGIPEIYNHLKTEYIKERNVLQRYSY